MELINIDTLKQWVRENVVPVVTSAVLSVDPEGHSVVVTARMFASTELEKMAEACNARVFPMRFAVYGHQDRVEVHFTLLALQHHLESKLARCGGHCGLNYCDENGCMERKRELNCSTDVFGPNNTNHSIPDGLLEELAHSVSQL
jgi:hypothetical protein